MILAVLPRLYHLNVPILDGMYDKQIFSANKARSIARPPFDLFRNSFDFLQRNGERIQLSEEVPVYSGLLAASYRLFGEREWLGRVWSIVATLVGLIAFNDLIAREFNRQLAMVATLFLAMCPLLIFYGRAIQPDVCMLAGILAAACCYRRYLDQGDYRWLLGAMIAGAMGALFKYYGLLALIPISEMVWRRHGWWGLKRWDFVAMAAAIVLPIALWIIIVFCRNPNPAKAGIYFLFQDPEILLRKALYKRLFQRFLLKDCGPLVSGFALIGFWRVLTRKEHSYPLYAWTFMAGVFYFLLGPKVEHHDYYELPMLPAAALWAGLGWQALWGRERSLFSERRVSWGVAMLALTVIIQSPLMMRSRFALESAQFVLAKRLEHLTSPAGRVLVVSPGSTYPVVHYSGREGWTLYQPNLHRDWASHFAHYQSLGAEYVALYFNWNSTPAQRSSYLPVFTQLPEVERHFSDETRKGRCEYYILSLREFSAAHFNPP